MRSRPPLIRGSPLVVEKWIRSRRAIFALGDLSHAKWISTLRRLAIHFRWRNKEELKKTKLRVRNLLLLPTSRHVFCLFLIVSNPSLFLPLSAGTWKKGGGAPGARLRRTRRDGTRIGRRGENTTPVDSETCSVLHVFLVRSVCSSRPGRFIFSNPSTKFCFSLFSRKKKQ